MSKDKPESFYDLSYTSNTGEEVGLNQHAGSPILVVNTASKCGLVDQYAGLQKLHEELSPEGLVVIGFPCSQFANQEFSEDEEIIKFCQLNYGVSFSLSTKVEVNGKNTHPVFRFVKSRSKDRLGLGTAIKWNFTKFYVHRDGASVKRWGPYEKPEAMREELRGLMAQ